MSELKTNPLMQVLDQRIRKVVEEVMAEMLAAGGSESLGSRFSSRVLRIQKLGEQTARRGRPLGRRRTSVDGKIIKTVSTANGPVIYTKKDKYLREPNGSFIKLSRVKGSLEPARAMGYSSAQYQLARRHRWPMPCPMDFVPPKNGGSGGRSGRE